MTVGVVDGFELIRVQKDEHSSMARGDELPDLAFAASSVIDAGEGVGRNQNLLLPKMLVGLQLGKLRIMDEKQGRADGQGDVRGADFRLQQLLHGDAGQHQKHDGVKGGPVLTLEGPAVGNETNDHDGDDG